MHSLAAPHEHFCAKFLRDYKEFDPEFFLALLHNIARAACKDIWCICILLVRNLSALGMRNALWSVESSIQD